MPLGQQRLGEETPTEPDVERLANIERARRIAIAAQLRTPSPPHGAPAVGAGGGAPAWVWVLAVLLVMGLIVFLELNR